MPGSRQVRYPERIKNRIKRVLVSIAPQEDLSRHIEILEEISQSLGEQKPYHRLLYSGYTEEQRANLKHLLPAICAELVAELKGNEPATSQRKTPLRDLVAAVTSSPAA